MATDTAARAVIFDCDGVLVDSEVVACGVAAQVLQRHGVAAGADEVMHRFLGRPLTYLIAELSREHGVDLSTGFLAEMRAEELVAMRSIRPITGMGALLAALSVPKCVASSSELPRVRTALTSAGLLDHFGDHIYTSEMVSRPKPFPDLFLHGAAQLGVAAGGCIVIEDSKAGVRAAVDGGMIAVGFAGGSHAGRAGFAEALLAEGAMEVVDDTAALSVVLRRHLETAPGVPEA